MLNPFVLNGRLTRDPELRVTATPGVPVARFTVAVERPFAKEGQQGDKRRVAEIVCDNVRFLDNKKGDKAPVAEEEAEIPADLPF